MNFHNKLQTIKIINALLIIIIVNNQQILIIKKIY